MRLMINNHMLCQVMDMCDLEIVIELYKSNIITEKHLLQKMGYRDVLDMYLSHQKELKNTHNKCPYECSVCENPSTRNINLYQCICCKLPVCYYNQAPCDDCMGSICENCFKEFLKECNVCHRLLCIRCLYDDHGCTATPSL